MPEITVGQHFERGKYGRQRSLEVVDDHLHQIVAHLLQLTKLAQTVLERIGGRLQLQQASHSRAKHQSIVGLGQKIVAPRLDAADPIARIVERCNEYHWDARRARIALDTTTELETRGSIVNTKVTRRNRDVDLLRGFVTGV